MLLGTLGAGLLGSLLTGKGKIRAGKGTEQGKKQMEQVKNLNAAPSFY